MSRAIVLLVAICLNAGFSYGMECSLGSKNIFQQLINSCPGILDSSDKEYCCLNFEDNSVYCCDATEFAVKSSWILLVVTVSVAVVIFLIALCISCLCCSCCPWYRVRHRGTVYGQVQVSSRVPQIVQSPSNVPQPIQLGSHTSYATNTTGMPQPPPYTNETYGKQAPYNPHYAHLNLQ